MKEEKEEKERVVGARNDRKHRLSIPKRNDDVLMRLLATVQIFAKEPQESFLSSAFSITAEVTRSCR